MGGVGLQGIVGRCAISWLMKASVPAVRGWCCFLGADACSAASMIPALFLYQPLQSASRLGEGGAGGGRGVHA